MQSICNIRDEPENADLSYVLYEDICNAFDGDTMIAVEAPIGTQLSVNAIEQDELDSRNKFELHMSSSTGPINVLLVNKDSAQPIPKEPTIVEPVGQVPPIPILETPKPETPPKVIPPPVVEMKKEEQEVAKPSSPARTSSRQTRQASIGVKRTIAAVMSGSRSLQKKRELEAAEESAAAASSRMATRQSPRKGPPQPLTVLSPVTRKKGAAKLDPVDSSQNATLPSTSNNDVNDADNLLDISRDLLFNPSADDKLNEQFLDDLISKETFSPLLRLSPPPGARDYFFNLDETEGMYDLFDIPLIA
ncbi:unnamed protein product [Larinioides sclopetarius]|uniref:E2F transcription factor CC-MB domain-containing protein n=1 Tax=Larinioides sclopetarius TaxID=280406 RepID=A0AAV2BH62_9ARAC